MDDRKERILASKLVTLDVYEDAFQDSNTFLQMVDHLGLQGYDFVKVRALMGAYSGNDEEERLKESMVGSPLASLSISLLATSEEYGDEYDYLISNYYKAKEEAKRLEDEILKIFDASGLQDIIDKCHSDAYAIKNFITILNTI